MKKLLIVASAIFVVFFAAIVVLLTVDFNRAGKENAYVQIVTDGEIEETKLDNGEVVKRYWYNQKAITEDGEEISVEYSAAKNLRKDAYLMLYLNDENAVTSYDEVEFNDIPKSVQERL